MPRYHFDTECGDLHYRDEEGIELEFIEQAQEQLAALLRDLTYRDEPSSFGVTISAKVRCEKSVVLHGACFLNITAPSISQRL